MNLPKVSIIIPVYNGSDFLKSSIECALSQTYENKEIIVVNDGSNDDGKTEEIALSFGDIIRYVKKENGGVSSALNYGINHMTGDYFSWLSHDDSYSPTKISDSVNMLKQHNLLGEDCIAFTSGYFINVDNDCLMNFRNYFKTDIVYTGYDVLKIMAKKGTLNGCCMLIPKAVFLKVGMFDESLRYSQDSLMWYKIFLSGCLLVCDNKKNVMYRLHSNQTSQTRRDLYEKDALYIARLLVAPLSEADKDNQLLFEYTKRLTKYNCKSAIDYIIKYGRENKLFSFKKLCMIRLSKYMGAMRCKFVLLPKKIIINRKI